MSPEGLKKDQVRFTAGERRIYASSPGVGRAFYGECGTPLTWEGDGGELGPLVELHISTFDDPSAFVPQLHLCHDERLPWFEVADTLPAITSGTTAIHTATARMQRLRTQIAMVR